MAGLVWPWTGPRAHGIEAKLSVAHPLSTGCSMSEGQNLISTNGTTWEIQAGVTKMCCHFLKSLKINRTLGWPETPLTIQQEVSYLSVPQLSRPLWLMPSYMLWNTMDIKSWMWMGLMPMDSLYCRLEHFSKLVKSIVRLIPGANFPWYWGSHKYKRIQS